MIVANILGKDVIENNPMLPISLAQDWPNDPFVVAEMQRLKAILPTLEDVAREIHEKAKRAFELGDTREYFAGMRLYAEVTGLIKKGADGGKSDDKLEELAAMLVDPSNTERTNG